MTSRSRFRLITGLAITGAITACVVDPLNPQPLPPGPDENGAVYHQDASVFVTADSGTKGSSSDAGLVETPPNGPDASGDAGADAADAADASDADADAAH